MTDEIKFPPENNFPAGYQPAKIWKWETKSGGQFANINRPIAGATHDKELPVGKHPHQLYSLATPNGVKIGIMFEELLAAGHSDAEYDAWLINIGEGDQFGSGFVDINPNSKIPAMMDHAPKGGGARSGCSNPGRSCSTWPKNSAHFCLPMPANALR
jgi:GST-like protein